MPRIRQVPQASRALIGDGVGSSQVSACVDEGWIVLRACKPWCVCAGGYWLRAGALLLIALALAAGTLPGCHRCIPVLPPPPLYRLQYIRFLTQTKAYSQILGRIFAGQRKNRFVQEE